MCVHDDSSSQEPALRRKPLGEGSCRVCVLQGTTTSKESLSFQNYLPM